MGIDLKEPAALTASYSAMLTRILVFVFFWTLLLTWVVAQRSIPCQNFVNYFAVPFKFAGFETLGIGYFLPAISLASISRMFRIHDRVSDLIGIRRNFDLYHILYPLAEKCGVTVHWQMIPVIETKRKALMGQVFYAYVGYVDPKVDPHLVYNALDNWSWLWVLLELSILSLISGVICIAADAYYRGFFLIVLAIMKVVAVCYFYYWQCIPAAQSEIDAIVSSPDRKNDIEKAFLACDTKSTD